MKRPVGIGGVTTGCLGRMPPSTTGWKPGEKKAVPQMETSYLDGAVADLSGSIAADALYAGPLCVLSIVANRPCKRLASHVLDHDPTHADSTAFFRRFQSALAQRGLRVQAITTDAAPLSPEPRAQVFGAVPHQLCAFHMIKAVTKAILRAVAQVRQRLASPQPSLPRGRPSTPTAQRAARKRQRVQQKVRALFEHRDRCVQHHLTAAAWTTRQRITQGLPPRRSLRAIRDAGYRLCDRRCRTDTAWAKLARLRHRVRRFRPLRRTLQKLFSPNREKALTFLDDPLRPSPSNAVERGHRRHRKMQKTVYRVRTQEPITARIALDMLREARKQDRQATRTTRHSTRAG